MSLLLKRKAAPRIPVVAGLVERTTEAGAKGVSWDP